MINITKFSDTAIIPTRSTSGSAGFDMYANINTTVAIPPHETVKIPTGIGITSPKGTFGALFPRSGIATKRGLRLANCVGVVDEDFSGNITIPIHNDTDTMKYVEQNERIAQIVFIPYVVDEFIEVGELEHTERGDGGFGSTGTK